MTGSPSGKVDVDFLAASGVLRVGAQQHQLRPRTAALLALLVGRADTLVEREELLQQVWPDAVVKCCGSGRGCCDPRACP